jgi:hypothetical protein
MEDTAVKLREKDGYMNENIYELQDEESGLGTSYMW